VSKLPFGHWIATALLTFAICLVGRSAHALSFTVNTTTDSHDKTLGDGKCADSNKKCSLRAAIEEADRTNAGVTITVPAGTYVLNPATGFGELAVTTAISITGAGSASTIIDARGKCRVIHASGNAGLTLTGVTLQNGNGQINQSTTGPSNPGGELYVQGGVTSVTAYQSVFTTTMAVSPLPFPGAGIAVEGFLELVDSTVSNNSTKGGLSGGTQYSGGGIFGYQYANVKLFYSTVSNNTAVRGGGIGSGGAYVFVVNSTISGNKSNVEGGAGLYIGGTFGADVMYSTITNNTIVSPGANPANGLIWGAGIRVYQGELYLGKCIISGNSDGRIPSDPNYSPDIGQDSTSQIQSFDDNVIGIDGNHLGNYIGFQDDAYDFFNGFVSLGALANNGGYTLTHALIDGDAINAYSGNGGLERYSPPSDDQTHYPRSDGIADSGSYED
jgi:hypothetical protein